MVGVTDIVEELHRQIASVAGLAVGPVLGPVLGPVAGSPVGAGNGKGEGEGKGKGKGKGKGVGVGGASSTSDVSTRRASGIPGFVYRRVRGVTNLVGSGLDSAFATYQQYLEGSLMLAPSTTNPAPKSAIKPEAANGALPSYGFEAALAAINGVFGDYLEATQNPLAINMSLRYAGQGIALDKRAIKNLFANTDGKASAKPVIGGKLLILVHGLCMNDQQWQRDGHDHGASLARDVGYTSLYVRYNSGRHIAANGEELALLLEQLVKQWPTPITELVIIGHSMGGLVARSASEAARQAKHTWVCHLKKMIFLGTPHHGAPLERAAQWVDFLLCITPFSAPFTRLSKVRSAGIQDLRHGNMGDFVARASGDNLIRTTSKLNKKLDRGVKRQAMPVTMPNGVKCYLIAATKKAKTNIGKVTAPIPGDGLVPVNSALGLHQDPALSLKIPATRRKICYGLDHFDLLSSADVYKNIHGWLAK